MGPFAQNGNFIALSVTLSSVRRENKVLLDFFIELLTNRQQIEFAHKGSFSCIATDCISLHSVFMFLY